MILLRNGESIKHKARSTELSKYRLIKHVSVCQHRELYLVAKIIRLHRQTVPWCSRFYSLLLVSYSQLRQESAMKNTGVSSQVFSGWWMVLVCCIAMAAGPILITGTFSVCIKPLAETFGWKCSALVAYWDGRKQQTR
jgi:hypothetical protein